MANLSKLGYSRANFERSTEHIYIYRKGLGFYLGTSEKYYYIIFDITDDFPFSSPKIRKLKL